MLVRDRNVLNNNWLLFFAELLHQNGHEVQIACDTYDKLGAVAPGHEPSHAIRITNLNPHTSSSVVNLWHKFRGKILPSYPRFKKLIKTEKPDVIICYFPNDLFNVTTFQHHNIPIIQMVHGYPPAVFGKILRKNKLSRNAWLKKFAQIHTYQVLLNSYTKEINPLFAPKNIVSIANPVKQHADNEIVDLNIEKKRIIYVARVEKTIKRPHLLVEAFAQIAADFPDWKVEIYGMRKYPEYDKEINDYIAAHHLEKQVFLMGYTEDVENVYRNADIQAFPSAGEGFGLGLADGMALGLPAIGFIASCGVNELIVDGHNGFLATDVSDFAAKLKQLMENKALRIKLGRQAHEDMKAYAPEIIMQQWEELLNKVVNKKPTH